MYFEHSFDCTGDSATRLAVGLVGYCRDATEQYCEEDGEQGTVQIYYNMTQT